jgi:integrase
VPGDSVAQKRSKILPQFLLPEEIDRILEKTQELPPDFYPMIVFYLFIGARRAVGME